MPTCPDCKSRLERRRGQDFEKTLPSGIVIKGYDVIWFCPSCNENKKNSLEELLALGKINKV